MAQWVYLTAFVNVNAKGVLGTQGRWVTRAGSEEEKPGMLSWFKIKEVEDQNNWEKEES